jgi:pimeloyl-ACP methyl ester carboxylesterase
MPFLVKTVASVSLLTLAFLYCSASCGRQCEANPAARTSFAYVQNGCGPTDAPAVEFYFTLIDLQRDLARLFSRGRHLVASDCGHWVHFDHPEVVTSAIRELVTAARSASHMKASTRT